MRLDCRPDFVALVWTETSPHADASLVRLGNCPPTSSSAKEAIFNVEFTNCQFTRMVTGDQIVYSNNLSYMSPPASHVLASPQPVVCSYERSIDWAPPMFDPVAFQTYDVAELVFHMGLMNDDFSGPAPSTAFHLGSLIPIAASVAQKSHQPLLLLLEECVAATTPELQPDSNLFPIIINKGCLVDSKTTRSRFEPRQKQSEIRLSLQAFKFALGEEVFIHCQLVAWAPNGLDSTKKACHYVDHYGWELLDDPSYSRLCDCCDSSCTSRKTRSLSGMAPSPCGSGSQHISSI
ncbi:zona pellucida sperm-binding protein 3-like [Diretmus argenteus]